MSQLYAEVIGDPIAQSKSPVIHNFWLGKLGIAAEYRACHVRGDELAGYFADRRSDPQWRGCNITIPHKEAAVRLVDRLDPRVDGIGAVNTVVRQASGTLLGTNTDIDGVGEAAAGLDLENRRAVVFGAGGAARATFTFLAGSRCSSVHVFARSPDKAKRAIGECGLDADIVPFAPGSGALEDAALAINATQLGMKGQAPMPEFILREVGGMAGNGLVFDMVYAPLETELLKAAARLGLRTSDGLLMLVWQAATAFTHFFGVVPPREYDEELRAMLAG